MKKKTKTKAISKNNKIKKQLTKAILDNFERKPVYTNITVDQLRDIIDNIPENYNNCYVQFGFVINEQIQNKEISYEMGCIGIRGAILHPDMTHVILCDDKLCEYTKKYSKSKTEEI